MDKIPHLPNEIWYHILGFAESTQVDQLSVISKNLYMVTKLFHYKYIYRCNISNKCAEDVLYYNNHLYISTDSGKVKFSKWNSDTIKPLSIRKMCNKYLDGIKQYYRNGLIKSQVKLLTFIKCDKIILYHGLRVELHKHPKVYVELNSNYIEFPSGNCDGYAILRQYNRILVMHHYKIEIFNIDCNFTKIGVINSDFHNHFAPCYMCMDEQDNVYTTQLNNVRKYDLNGECLFEFGEESVLYMSITIDKYNRLLIGDFDNGRIYLHDTNGRYLSCVYIPKFLIVNPIAITFDDKDNMIVADNNSGLYYFEEVKN